MVPVAPSVSEFVKFGRSVMAVQNGIASDWYYRMLGEEFGPVSRQVLDSLIDDRQISDDDEVREGATGSWCTVKQLQAPTVANGAIQYTGGTVFSLDSLSDAGLETMGSAPTNQEEWFYESL